MAQSVSNDALWEKLSEVDKKLKRLSDMLKTSNLENEQAIIKTDFEKEKDEIIAEIQEQVRLLGKHGDINLGVVNQNIGTVDDTIRRVLNIVSHIRKHQKDIVELQKTGDSYFYFRFFKVRKTTVAIAVLGLLAFILTLFCIVDR